MSILALLLGLLISHFAPGFSRLRSYGWLKLPAIQVAKKTTASRSIDWLPMLTLVLTALIVGIAAAKLVDAVAGDFGLLLLGLLVIIYTLGPRDLDDDIEHALVSESARQNLRLAPDANGTQAAATVLHAALARWFGVIFWFVLLGIPGALLYRAARVADRASIGSELQQAWFKHLLYVLNWPVLLLMTLAVALMTDFDRVRSSWSVQAKRWQIDFHWLDRLAVVLCTPDSDAKQGLSEGQSLAWRMLWIWLALLSLLLLTGWIA